MTIKVTRTRHHPRQQTPLPDIPSAPMAAPGVQPDQNKSALILVGIAVASLVIVAISIFLKTNFQYVGSQSARVSEPVAVPAPAPQTGQSVTPPRAVAAPAVTEATPTLVSPQLALVDPEKGTVKVLDDQDIKAIALMLRPHVAPFPTKETAETARDAVARLENAPLAPAMQDTAQAWADTNASCMDRLRRLAAESTVYFPPGSASLPTNAVEKIRAIGTSFERCPKAVLHVTGHSDASGDEQKNLSLSWQRADNTVAAMEAMGFDTARIDPVGFGTRLPAAEGDTNGEQDRRVEFHVLEMH